MPYPPVVSIIVPVYNRSTLIAETLESILAQSFKEWECIIVDDGSQDGSWGVMKNYSAKDPRFKVYKRPENWDKGAPSCRNFGFSKALGEYIQFFDSDDIMLPNMLKEKVEFFRNNAQNDFVVSKMAEFHEEMNWVTPKYQMKSANPIIDFLKYKIYFLTPGPLFKTSFLIQKGKLFDSKLKKNQEWEYYARLLLTGCQYEVIDSVHCLRRMHDESIKSRFKSSNEADIKFLKIMALNRLNLNTNKRFKGLLWRLFWKDYLRGFFLFLKFRKVDYLIFLSRSCFSFSK